MLLVLDREIPRTRRGDTESHTFYMGSVSENGSSLTFAVMPQVATARQYEKVPHGAIGLRELTLTSQQAQVVSDIIENRTAQCTRPPRYFPPGDEALLR